MLPPDASVRNIDSHRVQSADGPYPDRCGGRAAAEDGAPDRLWLSAEWPETQE